jgi:hypothetical protein
VAVCGIEARPFSDTLLTVRLADTAADTSAVAPPLPTAVVRRGSGHRPASRHGWRTPAVHSVARPVDIRRQNDRRTGPSRLRKKRRSGSAQVAAMEPVPDT